MVSELWNHRCWTATHDITCLQLNALHTLCVAFTALQCVNILLHPCTPKPRRDILGHSCFAWLIVIFNFYIKPLLVPHSALWTSPRVTRQFGRWPQRLIHGTGYKHIWHLCQKHVTRSVNYPAALCILSILAVTFTIGAWGVRLNPSATIKWLGSLRSWTFDHQHIPRLLLTARLEPGIQQFMRHCFPLSYVFCTYQVTVGIYSDLQ